MKRGWLALVVAALLFTACPSDESESVPPPSPSLNAEEIVESLPIVDVTVSQQDRLTETGTEWLTVSTGEPFSFSTAIIAFERGTVPLRCIEDVTLSVHVGPGEPRDEASVSVYPSNLVSPEKLREGQAVEVHGLLLDIKPKDEQLLVPDQGAVDYDVTELYKLWLEGGPFPSQGLTVPGDAPVVFALRATTLAEPTFTRQLASSESDTPPLLRIELKSPDCT